jgi:hypothetical protein
MQIKHRQLRQSSPQEYYDNLRAGHILLAQISLHVLDMMHGLASFSERNPALLATLNSKQLSQKINHLTLSRKCTCMQKSIMLNIGNK